MSSSPIKHSYRSRHESGNT